MGISHPMSAKKTRAAVRAQESALNNQADAIGAIVREVKAQREWIAEFNDRGFFGRLRWLVLGR